VDFQEAKDEFALRYYRWAQEDSRREVNEDLRLLRQVKSHVAIRILTYIEGLSTDERIRLSDAQIKVGHPRAAELLGEQLTTGEQALLEERREILLQPVPLEAELEGEPYGKKRIPRMNRGRFATLAKTELTRTLGQPEKKWRTGAWFSNRIGEWTVSTDAGLGSPPYYLQNIRKGERQRLVEHVSLLAWLGIGQTTWDLARRGDELETARAMATLCSHFLEAAPRLLEGLTLDA